MVTYRLGAVISLAVALACGAMAAPEKSSAVNTDSAAIEQAVAAYASKLKADEQKALDQAVASRTTALLDDPTTQVLGNRSGDVAIIEFFDYTCPYCKAVEPKLQQFLKDDRNVRLLVKEFPILTPESLVASKAALASVKQGKYERFHQALLGFRGALTNAAIFDIARTAGLDIERLRKDMDAPDIADAIIGNFNLARALRITATPAFIIDNHIVMEPSATIDFAKLIALARARL